jgi:hypothetical protein
MPPFEPLSLSFPFESIISSCPRETRFIVAGSAVAVPKLPDLDMGYPSNTEKGGGGARNDTLYPSE